MYNGLPLANGKEMEMQKLAIDGAGLRLTWAYTYDLVWRLETTVLWYPDQPWLCVGNSRVECFDPSGQMFHTTTEDMIISWGDGSNSGVIVPSQTQVANGQIITQRAVFAWPHLANAIQQNSILSAKVGPLTVN
jgi:hypothetical protein